MQVQYGLGVCIIIDDEEKWKLSIAVLEWISDLLEMCLDCVGIWE